LSANIRTNENILAGELSVDKHSHCLTGLVKHHGGHLINQTSVRKQQLET